MRIQHNILAMNAYRNYNTNTSALAKNLEKLSSGYKINRAGDDAAGLAISEKMRAQIQGLNAASKNVKDGTSLVKTAEGAMQEIQDMLGRMKYLATQSANGTYDNEVDRKALQDEVEQLKSEINRIADSANFNGIKLLDGSMGLNGDAFSISGAAAASASDGTIDVSGSFSAEDAGDTITHLEKAGVTTQTTPTFTIDVGNLAWDASALTADGTAKINVFGNDLSITLKNNGGTNGDGKYTASDIAAALKTAIQSDANLGRKADGTHDSTPASNTSVKFGGALFTIGGSGSSISFTYAGVYKADGTLDTTTTDYTADQATAINNAIGFGVSVSDDGGAVKTGDVLHNTTGVVYAQAKSPASYAGIDFKITSDLIRACLKNKSCTKREKVRQ